MRSPLGRLGLCCFCCLVFAAARLAALPRDLGLDQTVATVWTDRDGLPSDTVLDVLQDKAGYVWLAAYEGLIRFDGETFTVVDETMGFTGRSARVLELDRDGRLWVGTNTAGLYVQSADGFVSYGKAAGLPDLSVRALTFDQTGGAWVGTAGGVARQTGDGFAVAAGADAVGIPNFLLPLEDGGILVGSNLSGLWRVSERGAQPYLTASGITARSFSAAGYDPSGSLWLGTSLGQIYRIERNAVVETVERPELAGASINGFYTDPDGQLWIASDKGILYRRGDGFELYSEASGLASNVVSALWRDREGSLWVGTERGGVSKFSPGKFVNLDTRDGLAGDAVNAVVEDGYGSVWVAGDDGVSFLPAAADPYHSGGERRRSVDELVATLRGVRVRQVRAEADGSLWFATYSKQALLTLNADGSLSSLTSADGLPIDRVRFSYRGRSGALWVGTTAGPVRLDAAGLRRFTAADGLPNLFTLCALEDKAGRTWIGTDGGGVAVLEKGSFRVYTTDDGLAGNVVFRVLEDQAGRIWLCTSEGLSLWTDGKFAIVDRAVGLSRASVFDILESAEGQLWIVYGSRVAVASADDLAGALARGVARAGSGALPAIRSYDRLDGLAGQLTANAWAFINPRGIVYLPTLRGLSTYNPQSVPINALPPPVVIEQAMVDGKAVRGPRLTLAPSSRRLTIRYAALSFMVPQKVKFSYTLEGYDRGWITAGTNREIAYTNLPPGDYVFRVRAENNDGVPNDEGASLVIVQRPYVYQTWWFYLLVAVGLALAGFLVALFRLRQVERRKRELERLVEERTAELATAKTASDKLLLNVLPAPVADELKRLGRYEPRVYGDTTILFADLVNFTARSAAMTPEAITAELNEIFSAFDDLLAKRGCERIKTLGDGYLGAAGLSVAAEDHAKRLAGAAIDLVRWLNLRNRTNPLSWQVRVALHSGPVVGGIVGVRKYIFDIFGDTVNTTFRLQAITPPMGITVSNEVARRIGGAYPLIARPARTIKGKGEMASWFLRWNPAVETEAPAAAVVEAPLERIRSARRLYDAGSLLEAAELLEALDLSCCEPATGKAALVLLGHVRKAAGDAPGAREAWDAVQLYE